MRLYSIFTMQIMIFRFKIFVSLIYYYSYCFATYDCTTYSVCNVIYLLAFFNEYDLAYFAKLIVEILIILSYKF